MNTIEPVSLKELKTPDYASLIKHRIRKILIICSNYDAFILEEDGQIESQIYREYIDLNISNPPRFIWATTSAEAEVVASQNEDIDMVICMYNTRDRNVFSFAAWLKEKSSSIPFVLLTHFSREIYRNISMQDTSCVDYIFSWHGNADLIVAIIKLLEDQANADDDILGVGVQAILLVEDSVRYYSTYLPELYKLVLKQSVEFLKDNEYSGGIQKGYTLPGFRLSPRLIFFPHDNIKLEAGAYLLRYWGARRYPCYAYSDIARWQGEQYQHGFHALVVTQAQHLFQNIALVLQQIEPVDPFAQVQVGKMK